LRKADLPAVIREMKDRLDKPKYEKIAGELWTDVRILMGLRYEGPIIDQLLREVQRMKESVTYQEILNEGLAKGIALGVALGIAQEAKRILLNCSASS
jgi:predicted transposase YdaD